MAEGKNGVGVARPTKMRAVRLRFGKCKGRGGEPEGRWQGHSDLANTRVEGVGL